MKTKITRFIDWFEEKFNFIIDIAALLGGIFLILLAISTLIFYIFTDTFIIESFDFIFLPGFLGFLGIIILFALRITRSITRKA